MKDKVYIKSRSVFITFISSEKIQLLWFASQNAVTGKISSHWISRSWSTINLTQLKIPSDQPKPCKTSDSSASPSLVFRRVDSRGFPLLSAAVLRPLEFLWSPALALRSNKLRLLWRFTGDTPRTRDWRRGVVDLVGVEFELEISTVFFSLGPVKVTFLMTRIASRKGLWPALKYIAC